MVLGGLALAFSRLIDNSVVVLENIFRHMELGETPLVAAEKGGKEVALPVLAATLTTAIVFFPVVFLYGVSKFLFTALALAVVLSLLAPYVVAMTVVPLFCAYWIKGVVCAYGRRSPRPGRAWSASMPGSMRSSRPCSNDTTGRGCGVGSSGCDPGGIPGVVPAQPRTAALHGHGLFSAYRSRPVRHQSQDADRNQCGPHRAGRCPDREYRQGRGRHRGPEAGGIEYRFRSRILVHVYPEFCVPYRVRSGQPEREPSGRQLRIHGQGENAHPTRSAGTHHLFPVRGTGGCGTESWPADADRCPGQREQSGSCAWHGSETCGFHPTPSRSQ